MQIATMVKHSLEIESNCLICAFSMRSLFPHLANFGAHWIEGNFRSKNVSAELQ